MSERVGLAIVTSCRRCRSILTRRLLHSSTAPLARHGGGRGGRGAFASGAPALQPPTAASQITWPSTVIAARLHRCPRTCERQPRKSGAELACRSFGRVRACSEDCRPADGTRQVACLHRSALSDRPRQQRIQFWCAMRRCLCAVGRPAASPSCVVCALMAQRATGRRGRTGRDAHLRAWPSRRYAGRTGRSTRVRHHGESTATRRASRRAVQRKTCSV
jgi:hypothetical protein